VTPETDPGALDWDAEDYLAHFYERAAIAEFDGGLERPEAELQAMGDVLRIHAKHGHRGGPADA